MSGSDAGSDVGRGVGGYHRYPRPDVLRLVPDSCRRILDVGCGAGEVGRQLKEGRDREVIGIEHDPAPAAEAARHLDRVLVGDVARMEMPFPSERFDCILFADVLEHLPDPWAVLGRLRRHLTPRGYVLVSLPNVRHYPVVLDLARGRWRYVDEGVLDRTHLRFFTRATGEQMVRGAGFAIEAVRPEPFAPSWLRTFNAVLGGLGDDLLARQYLILARKAA